MSQRRRQLLEVKLKSSRVLAEKRVRELVGGGVGGIWTSGQEALFSAESREWRSFKLGYDYCGRVVGEFSAWRESA